MPSQKQLVDRGIEVANWPTFERYPSQRKHRKHTIGDVVGMTYDTSD